MIHLTIITGDNSCIVPKIAVIVDGDFQRIQRFGGIETSKVASHDDLLASLPREEDPLFFDEKRGRWFLHGIQRAGKVEADTLVGAFCGVLRVEDIQRDIRLFAERYEWALVPWADDRFLRAFAFITSDDRLHKAFLSEPGSVIDWQIPMSSVIATYSFSPSASIEFKYVVLDEYIRDENSIGRSVWEGCNCNRIKPNVLFWAAEDLRDDLGDGQLPVNCEFIRNDIAGHSIHRVLDVQSFTCVCREVLNCDPEGMRFVAGNTDVDAFSKLIVKFESRMNLANGHAWIGFYPTYSPAHDAPHYIAIADWWYMLDVGCEGGAFSFFAARDPQTVVAVTEAAMAILGGPESIVGFY